MSQRVPGKKVVAVLAAVVVVVVAATMAVWWSLREERQKAREALRRDLSSRRLEGRCPAYEGACSQAAMRSTASTTRGA